MSIDIDEALHPRYLLHQGVNAILTAAFGQYRTVIPETTSDSVRAFARRLSLSAYATHLYPHAAGTAFDVDGNDDSAIAMLEAARWMSAASSVQYTLGAGTATRHNPMRVNDPWSRRDGEPANGMYDTFRNPFARDSEPTYLHAMRIHFAESSQYLRDRYHFSGSLFDVATLAGGVWPDIAKSLNQRA